MDPSSLPAGTSFPAAVSDPAPAAVAEPAPAAALDLPNNDDGDDMEIEEDLATMFEHHKEEGVTGHITMSKNTFVKVTLDSKDGSPDRHNSWTITADVRVDKLPTTTLLFLSCTVDCAVPNRVA